MGEFSKAVQGSLLRINQIVFIRKMYFQGGNFGSCPFFRHWNSFIAPPHTIRKTARQVVLSRCYVANFAHIWGGGSIRALRSASVDANRSPPDFVHPYE